ncbi:MAG: ATP-binding cassette domain-containing protein [Phycisphaeraceae bacterium]
MPITLPLQHDVQSRATPTERSMQIAVMFGLSLDGTQTHTIIPPIELPLAPGQVVFVTGVSGGGKSTLLRLINEAITNQPTDMNESPPAIVWSDRLPELSDEALVDALALPEVERNAASPSATLEQVCHWLSLAGLNDAAVMLRKPSQLSEGQRHRLKLAQAMACAQRRSEPWSILLIDEFGSTLDRTTAFALARSLRRWVAKSNVCLVVATTHDDLLEPLAPDVLVEVAPGGTCEVHRRIQ